MYIFSESISKKMFGSSQFLIVIFFVFWILDPCQSYVLYHIVMLPINKLFHSQPNITICPSRLSDLPTSLQSCCRNFEPLIYETWSLTPIIKVIKLLLGFDWFTLYKDEFDYKTSSNLIGRTALQTYWVDKGLHFFMWFVQFRYSEKAQKIWLIFHFLFDIT